MSDAEYRALSVGDNAGNQISYRTERNRFGGTDWSIRYNGVIVLQGWTGAKRYEADDLCRAKIQRFIRTESWT